jgi:hypothetical protein
MTSRDFCYWLQGFFEVADPCKGYSSENSVLRVNQVETIRAHLALVFKHEIDPSFPAEQQAELNAIHAGKGKPIPSPAPPPPKFGGVGPDGTVFRC